MKHQSDQKLPAIIAIRTAGFEPLIQKWSEQNRGVPYSELLRRALKKELKPLAGKRHAHLVGDYQP